MDHAPEHTSNICGPDCLPHLPMEKPEPAPLTERCRCGEPCDGETVCPECGGAVCEDCATPCNCLDCMEDGHRECLIVVGRDQKGRCERWLRRCALEQAAVDEEQGRELLASAARLRAALEGR